MEMNRNMVVEITYDEGKNLVKACITVFASLSYCYFVCSKMKKGTIRLVFILPIVFIFTLLPMNFSTIHLAGLSGFFIGWLATFKLLLFAFDQSPLSSDPSVPLLRFISIACLPIKIQQDPPPNTKNTVTTHSPQITKKASKSTLNYALKCVIMAVLMRIYDFKQHMHPHVILLLYCIHVYCALEVILAIVAALARSLMGMELEPQFNDPYLATSLQDFWGRRWNLMVTRILHPTVYIPVRSISTPILGRRWAMLPAVLATFAVSGLMHELIFYYLGHLWPTGEVMCFFALHGLCLAVEIAVKRNVLKDKWTLHRAVSMPLTLGFVIFTASWLFFPQFLRCKADVRGLGEYSLLARSVEALVRTRGARG